MLGNFGTIAQYRTLQLPGLLLQIYAKAHPSSSNPRKRASWRYQDLPQQDRALRRRFSSRGGRKEVNFIVHHSVNDLEAAPRTIPDPTTDSTNLFHRPLLNLDMPKAHLARHYLSPSPEKENYDACTDSTHAYCEYPCAGEWNQSIATICTESRFEHNDGDESGCIPYR